MNAYNSEISKAAITAEAVSFRADYAKLHGTLFLPCGRAVAGVVLHGATGVPQGYYRAFATWLAETHKIACLTYDYRDFGQSATKHARHSKATMVDWGVRDQQAAQAMLEQLVPDAPVWAIGHSLGGLLFPFHAGAGRLARIITVASGAVMGSDHPWHFQPVAKAFWFGPLNWVSRSLGFMPGRALRIGEDLPLGVYLQWRHWCTKPGSFLSDAGKLLSVPDWKAVRAPMKFVAVSDDGHVPPSAVWRSMQFYPEAHKRQLTLRPKDFGLAKIGHIGAFARRNSAVWPALIADTQI